MTDAGIPSAVLRRERAQRAVARLADDIDRWLPAWEGRPEQTSQIARVRKTLRALLARLKVRADAIGGGAFADARALEADLAVAERLWRYYADRFDQRRDPRLGPTLRAADDVIWACIVEARALAKAGSTAVMPLPLACVQPSFTPNAITRGEAPIDLVASDRALARILAVLPVPLIGLPTGVVEEPWWLVLIAHEVGHLVQYELEPGAALIDRTGDELARAGGDEGETWRGWSREVFADAFAVAIAGAPAVLAIAELDWGTADELIADRPGYPPALVRVVLASELAARLGFGVVGPAPADIDAILRPLDAAGRERARGRLDRARTAAGALAAMPIGGATLAALAARVRSREEPYFGQALAGQAVELDPGRLQPLRVAAAAFRAYLGLGGIADDVARTAARRELHDRATQLMATLRDPHVVVRGGSQRDLPDAEAEALAADIEALLPGRGRATDRPEVTP